MVCCSPGLSWLAQRITELLMAWGSTARYSPVWHGMVQHGIAWRDTAWPGSAWHSPVQPSLSWHSKAQHGSVWHGTAWCVPAPRRAGEGTHREDKRGVRRCQGTLCAPSPAVPTLSQHRDTPATAALRPRGRATQGAAFCRNKGTLCTALGATRLHRPGSPAPSHGSGVPLPPRSPASLGLCSRGAGNEWLWGQAQQTPPPKKINTQRTPTWSSRWRCAQLRAEDQKHAVCIEKKPNQKPQDSSFAYLALLAVPGHVARPGHAVQPRGRGGLIPAAVPAQKRGIFWLLSLLFLVKVGHALTSGALPCLGTAHSEQKRKPQAREAELSTGTATTPERGTHRVVPGDWEAGRAAEPRIRCGTSRVGDAGVAAGGAGGAGAGR